MKLLTDSNKALKHKDMSLKQANDKILKLNNFIKQFVQLGNGKTMSLDAINSAVNQQPTTIIMAPMGNSDYTDIKTKIEQGDTEMMTKIENFTASKNHLAKLEVKSNSKIKFNPEVSMDAAMDDEEVMEGEIMDGDEDPDQIRIKKLQQLASLTLKPQANSAAASKSKTSSVANSKAKNDDPEKNEPHSKIDGQLPDYMMCVICCERRKEVMIQTCKHLVFCNQCDLNYSLKNADNKECPICRKKYAKTMKVIYS